MIPPLFTVICILPCRKSDRRVLPPNPLSHWPKRIFYLFFSLSLSIAKPVSTDLFFPQETLLTTSGNWIPDYVAYWLQEWWFWIVIRVIVWRKCFIKFEPVHCWR